ncbi:MAG: LptF/LptG family permease [Acidobacteria bacterium]|nr:LptF/LptG family permease [Acidobacteriota bacterium]
MQHRIVGSLKSRLLDRGVRIRWLRRSGHPLLIYRYLLLEIAPYFLLALLILTAIIFIRQANIYSELFVKKNVPPALVTTLLWSMLPRILIITLPVALLLSILLALGRVSSDNEFISLLACGISRKQVLVPLLGFAALVMAVSFYLSAGELHRSARRFRQIRSQLILQGIRTQMKPRVFDARFAEKTIYIRDINRRNDIWDRIFLVSSENGRRPLIITARSGRLDLGDSPDTSQLNLFDGYVHRIAEEEGKPVYSHEGFQSSSVRFDAKSREALQLRPGDLPSPGEQIQEMSLPQLLSLPREDPKWLRGRIEFHQRLALPLACLVFTLVGLSLGITRSRSGRSHGFVVSILVVLLYYLLFLGGQNLARSSRLPPGLALWGANLVLGLLALLVLREARIFARWESYPRYWFAALRGWWERRRPGLHRHLIKVNPISRWEFIGIGVVNGYLSLQFWRLLALTVGGLLALFHIFTLFDLSSDLLSRRIPWSLTGSYLLNLTPFVIDYLMPPSILVAALTLFALLSRSNEIAAFKASGMSIYRLAAPLLVMCGLLGAGLFVLQDRILPEANERQDRIRFYIKKGRYPAAGEFSSPSGPNTWFFVGDDRIIHFRRFDRSRLRLDDLDVYLLDPRTFSVAERWEARTAFWEPQSSSWELNDGTHWRFPGGREVESEVFSSLHLDRIGNPDFFDREVRKPEYLGRGELRERAAELRESGLDDTELLIMLHRRFAYPLACLAMGLAGIPFGLSFGRRGALFGVGLSLVLGVVYWMSLSFFEQLGRYDYISPALAAWSPNGLYAAFGAYFLLRART